MYALSGRDQTTTDPRSQMREQILPVHLQEPIGIVVHGLSWPVLSVDLVDKRAQRGLRAWQVDTRRSFGDLLQRRAQSGANALIGDPPKRATRLLQVRAHRGYVHV